MVIKPCLARANKNTITKEQAETIVKQATDSIIKQQKDSGKEPRWRQVEHCCVLRNAVVAVAMNKDSDIKTDVGLVLHAGSCGNASAYRQSLEKAKLISKQGVDLADEYQ